MMSAGAARVLIASHREVDPAVSRCATLEFEDTVGAIDTVDVASARAVPWPRRLARAECLLPSLSRLLTGPRRDAAGYELFFTSVHSAPELCRIQPLTRFVEAAHVSACNVDEVWAHDLPSRGGEIALLRRFDHLFTACHGAVEALSEVTGRPCHYLAPSVDAIRFLPRDERQQRSIDVYFMGRHREDLHRALREFARESGRFYLYDTSGHSAVYDPVEHRERLADLIGRSRYFVVDIAKANLDSHTGGCQEEAGTRYFEAAAGGAVLVGATPRNAVFKELFGWTDAVIELEPDARSISETLLGLEADPCRIERIRRTNVVESLRRHDGVYRWEQILATVGLPPTDALLERKRRLEELAVRIENDWGDAARAPSAEKA